MSPVCVDKVKPWPDMAPQRDPNLRRWSNAKNGIKSKHSAHDIFTGIGAEVVKFIRGGDIRRIKVMEEYREEQ
jgi:hypothetical protein